MAYTSALGADAERRGGSSPLLGTIIWYHRTMERFNADQRIAIALADKELEAHFPEKTNFGIVYQPINAMAAGGPSSNLNKIYTVIYNLPGGPTDQGIWITVDITASKVISFNKPQS